MTKQCLSAALACTGARLASGTFLVSILLAGCWGCSTSDDKHPDALDLEIVAPVDGGTDLGPNVDIVVDNVSEGLEIDVPRPLFIPCPTSGDLRQSESKELEGGICESEGERCGNDGYCNCYFWCDCTEGIWVCDSICDDSCWEDTVP